ncbi:MAG: adenine DNA glycosylase [Candidatus Westeberhardia cardiocondylae]|nr:adenine DNA glycosylase [Candidatus Westeberhardia cardiocondylae]
MKNISLLFVEKILFWSKNNGREFLPWRLNRTAYRVWVSEIMLQQTRVKTVIPYFSKFMHRFPTISRLAESMLDDVLCLWSGLGYYARARNLHCTAKIIKKYYFGKFPAIFDVVIGFPGIGRSTAGAILSLAFNQCYSVLDSNVKRVLVRYYNISCFDNKKVFEKKLWKLIDHLMPIKYVAEFNQAMMDFGSLVCTSSNPKCFFCPVNNLCKSYVNQSFDSCFEKKKKVLNIKEIWYCMLQTDNMVWLEKREISGVWGGLYSFPEFSSFRDLFFWEKYYGFKVNSCKIMKSIRHIFSHFVLKIFPIWLKISYNVYIVKGFDRKGIWYDFSDPQNIGLSSPIIYLLSKILKENIN